MVKRGSNQPAAPQVEAPKGASTPSHAKEQTRIMRRAEKQFGEGSFVPMLSDPSKVKKRFTTSLAPLDVAITGKVGQGIPTGRITTVYGAEHIGKTTLGMLIVRQVQQANGIAYIADTESTLQLDRVVALGVDPARATYIDEMYMEGVLDAIHMIVKELKGSPAIIFWDTVAGSPSINERGRSAQDRTQIGSHSMALSRAWRGLSKILAKSSIVLLLCNQLKDGAIGNAFASDREKDAMLGAKPIRFHSELILKVQYRRKYYEMIKNAKVEKGFEVFITVDKNKSGTQGVKARLVFAQYNGGKFDDALSCLETLRGWGAIAKGTDAASSIKFGEDTLSTKEWRKRYISDAAFKKRVHKMLEDAYAEKYLREEE